MTLLFDIWSVLTPAQRRWVVWTQALSIAMAICTVMGIASIAPFFSVLGNPHLIDQNKSLHWLYTHLEFTGKREFEVALGLSFVTLVLMANLVNMAGLFAMVRLAWWIGTDMQSTLFDEYLSRPYVFHARTHSAVLLNKIVHEATRAANDMLQNVFALVTSLATATLIIFSVLLLNPFAAAAMIVALMGGYVVIYFATRNRLFRAGQLQSLLYTEQTKIVNESLGAIKEILVLRIEKFFHDRFAISSRAFARAIAHAQLIGQSPKHVMECIAVAGLVLIALLAGGPEDGIAPLLGQLTFLAFAAYRLLPIMQQAFGAIVKIRASRAGFSSIVADLRLARARKPAPDSFDFSWRARPSREIRLKCVSFRYEGQRPQAVSGVSLRIPAGKAAGFVGVNGSGKTTLVDLIAGLLVPGSGHIEVDGITIDDASRPAWRSRIAYVPQNIFLLDSTIEQNIALGIPGHAIDKERLRAAARLAQLEEFIRTLPDGYHHIVGERGVNLSGGQRQRIGIARALYRDASVLILDEATNALDGLTEKELLATILRLRGRYTIIVIAHRLSTVRACDVVFAVDAGRLEGSGTYGDLLRNSGTFQQLVNAYRSENP